MASTASASNPAPAPTSAPAQTSRGELLAEAILTTKLLAARYLSGFNDVTHVRQVPDLPNHVAWCLGHCALTMHKVAGLIDGKPVPAGDFVSGDGTLGSRDKGHFDTEAVAFASRPEERHDRYPRLSRCIEIYNNAVDRLAATARKADDAALDRMVPWGAGQQMIPAWSIITRMIFHNGFHTGQIADLRRSLGFKSIFA